MTRAFVTLFLMVWLIALGIGFGWLWRHAQAPGRPAVPPVTWPHHTRLARPTDRAVLIVLAHPHCPCTRATVANLARLMAHCRSRLTACILFYKPLHAPVGWELTDSYIRAMQIPGVQVFTDTNGEEARQFGAFTSGQTLLYAPDGRRLFAGGITVARGHEGDSIGQSAVYEAAMHGTPGVANAPVYGCSLFETAAR